MLQRGSFQRRVFLTISAVAILPAILALVLATLALRETVASSGSAGPWDAVAESGRTLIESVEEEAEDDPELARAVREHREALSASLRLSRLYSEVTDRVGRALPLLALGTALVLGFLSLLAARRIARGLSRPLEELVGWTARIGRGEPLPPPETAGRGGVREFDRLRGSLREMAEELGESRRREVENVRLRSWTEMARRVAHELKNPLTPMRMAARTVAGSHDPATAEAGAVLLEEVERLDELARSFSRLGRIPEGPTSEVDVGELLGSLAELHGRDRVDVSVAVAADLPLVRGHYDALHRAIGNLVSNAVEAAGETEGPVRVRLRARVEGPAAPPIVVVEVEDSGPGVPPELRERIWEPDFTTRAAGTGLGLPLVLQTIRHHHGDVEVGAGEGGGAVFRIRLPVEGPDAGAAAGGAAQDGGSTADGDGGRGRERWTS